VSVKLVKNIAIVLITLLLASIILISCSPTSTESTPLKTTAAQPTTQAEPIELRYATHQPDNDVMAEVFIKGWPSEVEEATGGKVKITIYWSQSLCKQADQLDAVINGIADMTWNCQGWTPGRFPLDSVAELPFLFKSGVSASRAMWDLYPTFLKDEYKQVKLLEVSAATPQYFFSTKPVKTLEDIKGMKTYAAGTTSLKMLEYLGATPVQVPWPEQYDALQRGIIEGVLSSPAGIIPNQAFQAIKYALDLPFACTTSYSVMNKEKFASLPADVQQKIDQLSGLHMAELHGKGWDGGAEVAWQKLAELNVKPTPISQAEAEKFKKAVAPLYDSWIADMEAKGLPGQEIYDEVLKLSAKYSQ